MSQLLHQTPHPSTGNASDTSLVQLAGPQSALPAASVTVAIQATRPAERRRWRLEPAQRRQRVRRNGLHKEDGDFGLLVHAGPFDITKVPSRKRAEARRRHGLQSEMRDGILGLCQGRLRPSHPRARQQGRCRGLGLAAASKTNPLGWGASPAGSNEGRLRSRSTEGGVGHSTSCIGAGKRTRGAIRDDKP